MVSKSREDVQCRDLVQSPGTQREEKVKGKSKKEVKPQQELAKDMHFVHKCLSSTHATCISSDLRLK